VNCSAIRARFTPCVTGGGVNGVVEANSVLHRQETDLFADVGYQALIDDLMPRPMCNGMDFRGTEISIEDIANAMSTGSALSLLG
jgi:hypothetical protein